MPSRLYSNWNKRLSDGLEQIEPYRKYFFVCEGANTEQFYFKHFINNRKKLNIHSMIDVILIEKLGDDRDITYPLKLIKYANEKKLEADINFDAQRDYMIIVFDADIFEYKSDNYKNVLEAGLKDNILGVTNPSFELFLLLHFENSWKEIIQPFECEFLKEDNLKNKSFAYSKLLEKTGINSKKNPKIGKLADHVLIAIEQEKYINQDIQNCKGKVTSNIGKIIEMIINDRHLI